jgi:translation initiation factor IF-3
MVSVAAGFALALAVSCLSFRRGAVFHAPGLSSSMRFPTSLRVWVLPAKLMVVAWYSPSYKSEKEEDDDEEGLWGGGD